MISLPPDLVAFLSTVLRGMQLAIQAIAIGGIASLLVLIRPLRPTIGENALRLESTARNWIVLAGTALAVVVLADVALGLDDLVLYLDLSLGSALGADFVLWGSMLAASALGVAAAARALPRIGPAPLVICGLLVLCASVMSSHAAARIDGRGAMLVADFLHQAGAGAWIGGIPFLLLALARTPAGAARLAVGRRGSALAASAVAVLGLGAALLAWGFIGSLDAFIGTAYGAMTAAKMILLAILLLLGLGNFLAARTGHDPNLTRLFRFAEVEIGIGLSVMFVAASLASQPPAIDQTDDRASLTEIVERMAPEWPRLSSPELSDLSLNGATSGSDAAEAADRAWSEYNHHWAGLFVLAMGLLALAERAGLRPARHWPLIFLLLAAMLFVRSDPESWPLGPIPFFERLADPEVMQHRLVTLVIVLFGLFEWMVRTGRLTSAPARLAFPILCALGGALLLTHSHTLTDVKQRYLIEISHIPMGLLGITAGWARWLELRGTGWPVRLAAWIWPLSFALIGLILLDYRES